VVDLRVVRSGAAPAGEGAGGCVAEVRLWARVAPAGGEGDAGGAGGAGGAGAVVGVASLPVRVLPEGAETEVFSAGVAGCLPPPPLSY
jgi:hypothetical protein